jgi:ribosomal protein S2
MMDEKEKLNRHLPGAKFPEDIVKYMWTVDPVEEAQRALHARA